MQTKHTPGPWITETSDGGVINIIPSRDEGKIIVSMPDETWGDQPERRPNAKLISAAPEMYEELTMADRHIKVLIEMLSGERRKDSQEIEAVSDRKTKRDAALRKARGEQ